MRLWFNLLLKHPHIPPPIGGQGFPRPSVPSSDNAHCNLKQIQQELKSFIVFPDCSLIMRIRNRFVSGPNFAMVTAKMDHSVLY